MTSVGQPGPAAVSSNHQIDHAFVTGFGHLVLPEQAPSQRDMPMGIIVVRSCGCRGESTRAVPLKAGLRFHRQASTSAMFCFSGMVRRNGAGFGAPQLLGYGGPRLRQARPAKEGESTWCPSWWQHKIEEEKSIFTHCALASVGRTRGRCIGRCGPCPQVHRHASARRAKQTRKPASRGTVHLATLRRASGSARWGRVATNRGQMS